MVQVTSHRVKQNMHKDIQKCDHFGFGNRKAAKVSCMKQKIYLCSPWGFSSLVRTFLSLVLWAAGSQFSCFSQRCTDSQVRLQTLNQCGLGRSFSLRICTWIWLHTHTFTLTARCCCCWWEGSLILLAVPPSSLLFVLPQCDFSGLNSAGLPEKFNLRYTLIEWISFFPRCTHVIRCNWHTLCQICSYVCCNDYIWMTDFYSCK